MEEEMEQLVQRLHTLIREKVPMVELALSSFDI